MIILLYLHYNYINNINIINHSLDDCDNNKLLKLTSTVWQDSANTNCEITFRHGVRRGSTSVTHGICNNFSQAIDLSQPHLRRRTFLTIWLSHLYAMTPEERLVAQTKFLQFQKLFNGKAVLFFKTIQIHRHSVYYTQVKNMYSRICANESEVRRIVPETMIAFQAILLNVLHQMSVSMVKFPEDIIDSTFEIILKNSFRVCITFNKKFYCYLQFLRYN